MGEVQGHYDIRKRSDEIHRVADDKRTAFMAAQYTGRERPGDLKIADVRGVDLIELRISLAAVVARLDRPIRGIARKLDHVLVGVRLRREARRSDDSCDA